MDSIQGSCNGCNYSLHGTTYTLCLVCNEAKLCPLCSIADVPLCRDCVNSQALQTQQLELALATKVPCNLCQGVYRVEKCKNCSKMICDTCDTNPNKHRCARCQGVEGCTQRRVHVCCYRCWCVDCFARHEPVCPSTKFYLCNRCNNKVLTFGDGGGGDNFCPVEWCPRKYGCSKCNVRRKKGLYCDYHLYDKNCFFCHLPYPVAGTGAGVVKSPLQHGNGRVSYAFIETCDICMDKIRAIVESILILAKRKGQRFERGLMNKIMQNLLINLLQPL